MNSDMRARSAYVFTSESVSEGHPDKICDQVSDAIVDACLQENDQARTAIEVMAATNTLIIAGEYRDAPSVTKEKMADIAREVVRDIGYEQDGFHWEKLAIHNHVHAQSSDIAVGVDAAANKDEGAGDQGIMFGYATNETPVFMPAPIYYSHRILHKLSEGRRSGKYGILRPDAKSQVSLVYRDGMPTEVRSVVLSTQHAPEASQADIRAIAREVAAEVLPGGKLPKDEEFFVNPTGRFIIGGPDGDAGLTGRKIIVDTYGGAAPHGGGAFSGKDPTKVDRSAAYIARYLAKNVVAAGLAERCTIQLSYAIGVSRPVSFYLNLHEKPQVDVVVLEKLLQEMVDLTPRGIRTHLNLNRPIYQKTASYGHFGREAGADGSFSWERTDLVDALRSHFGASLPKAAVVG